MTNKLTFSLLLALAGCLIQLETVSSGSLRVYIRDSFHNGLMYLMEAVEEADKYLNDYSEANWATMSEKERRRTPSPAQVEALKAVKQVSRGKCNQADLAALNGLLDLETNQDFDAYVTYHLDRQIDLCLPGFKAQIEEATGRMSSETLSKVDNLARAAADGQNWNKRLRQIYERPGNTFYYRLGKYKEARSEGGLSKKLGRVMNGEGTFKAHLTGLCKEMAEQVGPVARMLTFDKMPYFSDYHDNWTAEWVTKGLVCTWIMEGLKRDLLSAVKETQ